jgi:hypothetical protein
MTLFVLAAVAAGCWALWRFGIVGMVTRTCRGVVTFAARGLLVGLGLAVGWSMFGAGGLMLAGLGMGVSWWASLYLKEWSDCPACGGSARHRGIYATGSFSLCGRCAGTNGSSGPGFGSCARPGRGNCSPARVSIARRGAVERG